MIEMNKRKLEQIARIVTGSTPSSREVDPWGDDLDFITPSDQRDNSREALPSRRLSAAGAKRLSSRIVPAKSTNLTCIGSTIGKVSMARTSAVTNQQINSIIALPGISDPDFIYYMIKNWSPTLKGHASGSATPIINKTVLSNYQFQVPGLGEQEAIGEVLSALDDKIAANTALASISLSLAEHIFLKYLTQEETELRDLGSISSVVLGGTPSRSVKEYWANGTVPWLNSGKANETRVSEASELISEDALNTSAAKMMPKGSTLVAITGATLGQVARLEIEACGNQSLIGIWASDESLNDWLYLSVMNEIPQLLKGSTGAAQQHVNKKDISALTIPLLVDRRSLEKFGVLVRPLLNRCAGADAESRMLRITRDTLLPQLMSGKLRVKDAESILEAANV